LEQTGEYRIDVPRDLVWRELNDPDALGKCISGCQEVTRVDDEHFDVTVKAKIGPVSATFQAAVALADIDPPNSYVIQGNIKGGAAGFAKGSAKVDLADDAGATILRYAINASVGGKLAQIGSRLVDGAARKMANDFFAAFTAHLSDGATSRTVNEGVIDAADGSSEFGDDRSRVVASGPKANMDR
jgi:carbon monoxide dehydrogenase subunit G